MCKRRKRLRNKNATFTNNLAAENSCAPNSLLKWYQWFSSPFSPKSYTLNFFFALSLARSLARSFIHSVGWACVYLFYLRSVIQTKNSHLAFKVVNACQNEPNILNIFSCCFCRVSTRVSVSVSVCVAIFYASLEIRCSVLMFLLPQRAMCCAQTRLTHPNMHPFYSHFYTFNSFHRLMLLCTALFFYQMHFCRLVQWVFTPYDLFSCSCRSLQHLR